MLSALTSSDTFVATVCMLIKMQLGLSVKHIPVSPSSATQKEKTRTL